MVTRVLFIRDHEDDGVGWLHDGSPEAAAAQLARELTAARDSGIPIPEFAIVERVEATAGPAWQARYTVEFQTSLPADALVSVLQRACDESGMAGSFEVST